jgi:hypothetical protein
MLFNSSNDVVTPMPTAKQNDNDDEEIQFPKMLKKCVIKDAPLPSNGKDKFFYDTANNVQIQVKKRWAFLKVE